MHRPYVRCSGITTKGLRCRALVVPGESVCIKHLAASDPRRVAFMADHKRRVAAHWQRRREAKAKAAA